MIARIWPVVVIVLGLFLSFVWTSTLAYGLYLLFERLP